MRNAMKEYGLPEPKFENRRNEFVVTLYNKAEVEKEAVNTEPVGDLLAFCHEPKTRQEIAAFLGVKTVFYAMQHYVQPLLASEKLAMTIPEKPKSRNLFADQRGCVRPGMAAVFVPANLPNDR